MSRRFCIVKLAESSHILKALEWKSRGRNEARTSAYACLFRHTMIVCCSRQFLPLSGMQKFGLLKINI